MKVISWNIRGINEKIKKILLKQNVSRDQPLIMIIQETKCQDEVIQTFLSNSLVKFHFLVVYPSRSAGGLAICCLRGDFRPRFKVYSNQSLNTGCFGNIDVEARLRSHPRWLWGVAKLGLCSATGMRDCIPLSSKRLIYHFI